MNVYKLFWFIRGIFYKILFKKMGFLSYLGKPIFISGFKNIEINSRVRIFPNARIESIKSGKIIINNNVSIGPNINITSINKVFIDEGVTISANVFITDMDHDFSQNNQSIMKNSIIKSSGTFIGKNSFIGSGAVILAGTTIGKSVVIGANLVVRGDFKDGEIISSNQIRR